MSNLIFTEKFVRMSSADVVIGPLWVIKQYQSAYYLEPRSHSHQHSFAAFLCYDYRISAKYGQIQQTTNR